MVSPSEPSRAWRAADALWPLAFLAVFTALQLTMPAPWDVDTGYHVAVTRLMREHGILREFPWTRFSWLADHYADKELLFHLALLPVAALPWITAARVVGAVLGAALLTTLWAILRAERVRHAGIWTLAALLSSSAFVFRAVLVRPHLLSVPLSLVVLWAAARRRLVLLGIAAALYPLCYTAFHVAVILVVIAEVASALAGRGFAWRPLAVAAAGLAVGIALHPNSANLLRLFWIVNVEILGGAWTQAGAFGFGGEFEPFSLGGLPLRLGLPAAFALAAAVFAWRNRREDPLPLAFSAAALAWLAMTLRTQRFVEYAAPFSAAALALSWRWMPRPRTAGALVAGGLAALAAWSGPDLLEHLRGRGPIFSDEAAAVLRRAVPADASVFTCEWDTTGEAMIALPGRRFMVALDPFLFFRGDPQRFQAWRALLARSPAQPAGLVRDAFDSRYALCLNPVDGNPAALVSRLRADPQARILVQSRLWTLLDLAP
jgi:hypothetical protein